MRLIGILAAGAMALSGGALANPATSALDAQKTLAWPPGAPADQPIQLIVSIPDQHVSVYVGGELVAESNVSTGKRGHSTPTGVFSILEKKKFHRSNLYSAAPMPFMQRLTWSGVALHASGHVPNYPASHGCVRMPPSFAKKLYGLTGLGGHVIISSKSGVTPFEISHSNLFQPAEPAVVALDTIDVRMMAFAGGYSAATAPDAGLRKSLPVDAALPGAAPAKVASDDGDAARVVLASAEVPLGTDIVLAETPEQAKPVRDPAPLRILVTRRSGRELVRDVQLRLKALGFDPGKIDGWMGRDTGSAIQQFQESRGLQTTGAMSEELVEQLYEASGLGAPATGHIYVRQHFRPVFDARITIADADKPLGDHLFTAMGFGDGASEVRWQAVTLSDGAPDISARKPDADGTAELAATEPVALPATPQDSAAAVLDRIDIPAPVRKRIAEMLTPGSSIAISDGGISRETTAKGTDFVILTR